MEFFINKKSTLPLLKLQVVKDGRSDYNNFMKTIELSAIFFSMISTETGIPKISTKPAGFVEKTFTDPNAETEYYIYYQFSSKDTDKPGRYEGQFLLRNDDGNLILPIYDKLYINVLDSFIADDLDYDNCFTSEFPCCVDGPSVTPELTPCVSCPACTQVTPTPTPTVTRTPSVSSTPDLTPTQTPTTTQTPYLTPSNTPGPTPSAQAARTIYMRFNVKNC